VIEILLGLLTLAGAVVILMGAGDTLGLPVGDLFPLIGFRGTALIVLIGVLLVARGAYRRSLKRLHHRRWELRSIGLMWTVISVAILLGIGVPLLAEPMNLFRIGGFPLGYYLSAQGLLVALVMLAFIFVRRQDAIDADEGSLDPSE
jgi:putative solute:sodium symporter small subunit